MQSYRVVVPYLWTEIIGHKLYDSGAWSRGVMMGVNVVNHVLWYGVVTRSSPGMTTEYATDSKVKSFEGAMLLECFNCILRASRSETARRGSEW